MDVDASLVEVLERSKELGLLGPGDLGTHIANAQRFAELLSGSRIALDLGSGGGLPGLVVAMACPDLRLTLLDAGERRVAFLRSAVRDLGIGGRVDVQLGRAEALARNPELREQFDTVVARSFGAPAVTAECAAGFLRLDGKLLVSEPAASSDRWPALELATVGLEPGPLHRFDDTTIRELRRVEVGMANVPRRVGVPGRRPLYS